MKALVTGASSGLGKDFAIQLSEMGYDLILVARRKDRLEELKKTLKTNVEIIPLDLSSTFNCAKLFDNVKDEDIDILINNAGFGIASNFVESNLEKELVLRMGKANKKTILVEADKNVPIQTVVDVFDIAKKLGAAKLGIGVLSKN